MSSIITAVGSENILVDPLEVPKQVICSAHPVLRFMKGYVLGFQHHHCYEDEPETIVAIAVKTMKNRQPFLYIGYAKARQHHLVRAMSEDLGDKYTPITAAHQGFLTSRGRFVHRSEARRIAEEQNQLLKGASQSHQLHPEDLW